VGGIYRFGYECSGDIDTDLSLIQIPSSNITIVKPLTLIEKGPLRLRTTTTLKYNLQNCDSIQMTIEYKLLVEEANLR
jgi:hypothetical protein